MKLYSYFRSSAAYRVRIALNLKQIPHEIVPINLLEGKEKAEEYLAINPQGLVPALAISSGEIITQSQAIIDYLERVFPTPALIAHDPIEAAQQQALAAAIACDIHPLNNLRVLKYLAAELSVAEEDKTAWYAHWISEGFRAIESQLSADPYSCGKQPGIVDAFLIPQVFNALRFEVTMDEFPNILAVYQACNQLVAFQQAAPEAQPDAV